MTLQPGQMLSHYRLVEKIGEGGMGVVWKAEDTKLSRPVAVKVLPSGLAEDKQRLARFEREAKLLAALNHPNVAAIHGFEHAEGVHFIVLELVDGQSLAQMTKTGPLPLEEALDVCRQVAEGLQAAHDAGVIHRDLKPGNVIVTAEGKAKVLDFGLAKGIEATAGGESGPDLSMSPTVTFGATQAGVVLGTAPYMSPEQARGKSLDKRTDIFSFGCLLYECLSGRLAFPGETVTDTLSGILQNEPDWEALPPRTPRRVRELMERCLEKSPRNRLHDIADARIDLERSLAAREWTTSGFQAAGGDLPGQVIPSSVRYGGIRAIALATIIAAVGLAAWVGFRIGSSAVSTAPLRAELTAPPGIQVSHVLFGNVTLSPDGDHLAFVGVGESSPQVMIRTLSNGEIRTLQGTTGASYPFWSPDGRWVAFFADRKLKKVQAGGGPVQIISEAHSGRGGSWGSAGVIIFAPDIRGPLFRVSDAGGTPEPVTQADKERVSHRNPHFLSDGTRFLFIERAYGSTGFGNIMAGSLGGSETRLVVERGSNPQVAAGTLFYVKDNNLVAQAFDEEAAAAKGPALPVASGVEYYNPRDIGNLSVSGDTLVYRNQQIRTTQLAWFDRRGRELGSVGDPGHFTETSRISGDGLWVAVTRTDESGTTSDLWVMDLERGRLSRSTFVSTPSGFGSALSFSGDRIVVNTTMGALGGRSVWLQNALGGGEKEEFTEYRGLNLSFTDWSPDGRFLLGTDQRTETSQDVVWIDLQEPQSVRTLTGNTFIEWNPCFVRGGGWVAYNSNETGRAEVYLISFPGGEQKLQVSRSGGSDPVCSSDGSGILYSSPEGFAFVPLQLGDSVEIGEPEILLDAETASRTLHGVPIGFDGKRFLALKYTSDPTPEPLRLVRGWKSLLDN